MALEIDTNEKRFFTPEWFVKEKEKGQGVPRGQLLIASCRSGSYMAAKTVARYREHLQEGESESDVLYLEDVDFQFSDSETCVRLERHVGGHDVFLFQALRDPTQERSIDQNYMAFLIAARAFRENGASHVTGILPYLAYARQDKPTRYTREPTTVELMADISVGAGIDRLVTWHPHTGRIPGYYGGIPVDVLEALPLFVQEFDRFRGQQEVIVVAPDVGASKLVTYLGRALELESAVASKYRVRPEEAIVSEVIGDFRGKRIAIILDDMISSGGTIYAATQRLVEESSIEEVYIGVSHNLCTDPAYERLQELHEAYQLQKVIVTNSIPQTKRFQELPFLDIKDLSDTLARVINRIHYSQSVSELFVKSATTELA